MTTSTTHTSLAAIRAHVTRAELAVLNAETKDQKQAAADRLQRLAARLAQVERSNKPRRAARRGA